MDVADVEEGEGERGEGGVEGEVMGWRYREDRKGFKGFSQGEREAAQSEKHPSSAFTKAAVAVTGGGGSSGGSGGSGGGGTDDGTGVGTVAVAANSIVVTLSFSLRVKVIPIIQAGQDVVVVTLLCVLIREVQGKGNDRE
ncbi:hypothetical protein HZH68_012875 [Vespula germanica]|uniref:Uncharacterized protein n=1 Tax=Vespula germanica TaxID=30212 RepID=A0A834MY05_VESGE|nr:hypothetical protein HZH68_012875 [Vespula germanica]